MAKIKRMLAMFLVMVMLVSALPMQALAADETVIENETVVDGNVKTEIKTETTTSTDEATGKVTVEVKFTESTTGTNDAGAKVEGQASGESKTVSDSKGNVVESSSSSESFTTTSSETTENGVTTKEETSVATKDEISADGNSISTETATSKSTSTNEDGKEIVSDSFTETTTDTTTVDSMGNSTQQTVTEGAERKEWNGDVPADVELPSVDVPLVPDKETEVQVTDDRDPIKTDNLPEGSDDKEYDYTVTDIDIDRTVTATTSKIEVTNKNSNGTFVSPIIPEKNENPNTDLDMQYWDDPEDVSVSGEAPEGYPYQVVGAGQQSNNYISRIYVIYEKDENGQPLKDENGEYVIKELRKVTSKANEVLKVNGVPTTDINENFDQATGTTAAQAFLEDKDGNVVYVYCCDLGMDVPDGTWYAVNNLEDVDYYASEEAEDHIRSIVVNGYWGTESGTGSLDLIKEKMKEALKNGEIDADVEISYKNKSGKNVTETVTLTPEIIDGLTNGEALDMTQAAIWAYSNGCMGVQDGRDGYILGNVCYGGSNRGNRGNGDNPEDMARMTALYQWLVNMQTEEESTTVINEQNSVTDMSLTVKDQVNDHKDNKDGDDDNDVYNTELNFKLAFVPGENDELYVCLMDTQNQPIMDADGQPIIKRLADPSNPESEGILPDDNGVYTLTGLQLSENKNFEFDLRLQGTQYLENGVYLYTAQGGTDKSQTLIGMAEGTHDVNVSASMTIKFDVDENNKVVVEHKWRSETDPVVTPPEPVEEPEEEEEEPEENEDTPAPANWTPPQNNRLANDTVEIAEEPVPLAAPVKTGDNTVTWIAFALMIACCMIAINVYDKKRSSEIN